MTPEQQERLNAALRHVEMGFAVMSVWGTFPSGTCKCAKGRDCTSPGKHPIPRDGFKAASRDAKQVTTMLSHDSNPNYGIVWPEDSPDGIVFEWDVDGKDWKTQIEALKTQFGPLPKTKTTRSPSGGLHVFYKWPDGVPVPEGNHFHGFVVRWPWRGYVVGPGSRINGTMYADVGTPTIATLPPSWAVTEAVHAPLITVSEGSGGYDLPERILIGHRHDEITRFVASRWNKGISKAEIEASVRSVLIPLMEEAPNEAKLRHDIDEAWNTAVRKWKEPGGEEGVYVSVQSETGVEERAIDPLAIESRIERPKPLDLHAVPVPTALAMLLDHLDKVTDAPHSSLALASIVQLAALMGRRPLVAWNGHQRIGIFGALVGESNYGRKGAAIRETQKALRQVDPLLPLITEKGFASGEAFVDLVAESVSQNNGSVLIVEQEMASILTIAAREGNTLSYQMREAWDGDPLKTRTRKTGASVATEYHVCMLGATTPGQLEARLSAIDIENGWANRWLWFWAEKRGGGYDRSRTGTLDPLAAQTLRDAITLARTLNVPSLMGVTMTDWPTMTMSPAAVAFLDAKADALDRPALGVIGSLSARMPPVALRVAMVAALLDIVTVVEVEHLEFGFAMTDYAVESMRAVFGLRVDDDVAMFILSLLGQSGGWMNTTDLKKSTGKDYPRVQSALRKLLAAGVIVREDRPARGGQGGANSVGYRERNREGT